VGPPAKRGRAKKRREEEGGELPFLLAAWRKEKVPSPSKKGEGSSFSLGRRERRKRGGKTSLSTGKGRIRLLHREQRGKRGDENTINEKKGKETRHSYPLSHTPSKGGKERRINFITFLH